jgi:hypothetical protein
MPVRHRGRFQPEPAVVLVPAFEPARVTSPVCGLTRFLLVGFVLGTVVSSVTGNDVYGWAAALIGVAALAVVQRVRGTAAACAVRPAPVPARRRAHR